MKSKDSKFKTRRLVLRAAVASALAVAAGCAAAERGDLVTVYKSPTCGCCGDWVKHLR